MRRVAEGLSNAEDGDFVLVEPAIETELDSSIEHIDSIVCEHLLPKRT